MMAALSRTASSEGSDSHQLHRNTSLDGDMETRTEDMSSPPNLSTSHHAPSLAFAGRVPSHSLLSATPNVAPPSRKSRFAHAGTISGNIDRASISMPPPTAKPSSVYKPSDVRRPAASQNASSIKEHMIDTAEGGTDERSAGDNEVLEDLERSASLPDTQSAPVLEPQSPSVTSDPGLKPPTSNLSKPGDRLSFSSLVSLGSALYNGATGLASAPPSAASSTAGSIKSVVSDPSAQAPTPLSPSLGQAVDKELSSTATTATDPVSVIANSQALHQGVI